MCRNLHSGTGIKSRNCVTINVNVVLAFIMQIKHMKETRRLSRTWFSVYVDVNVFVLHTGRRKIQPGGRKHSLNVFVRAFFICFQSEVYELGHVCRR